MKRTTYWILLFLPALLIAIIIKIFGLDMKMFDTFVTLSIIFYLPILSIIRMKARRDERRDRFKSPLFKR